MDLENSYFFKLPVEMIRKIFGNLSAFDISTFLEAYPQYLQVAAGFTKLDLTNHHFVDLIDGFYERRYFIPENIVTININNIYWISEINLQKFLTKFINLKNLYAIETKLSINNVGVEAFNCTKLEKLAVSYTNSIRYIRTLPTIRSLYLYCPKEKYNDSKWIQSYVDLLIKKVFINVRSIWVCQYEKNRCKTYRFTPEGKYCNTLAGELENITIQSANPHWGKLQQFTDAYEFNSCFNYKDIEVLKSGTTAFDFVHLQELSFINIFNCDEIRETKLIALVQQVLLTPHVKRLCRLSVHSCFLYISDENRKLSASFDNSIGKLIFQHLNGLQVLEIEHHDNCPKLFILASSLEYKFIAQCKHLKQLKIDFSYSDGAYLKDVSECTLLEQLFLEGKMFNNSLSSSDSNVCASIRFAKNLRNFKYTNPNISLNEFNEILDGLHLINSKKLKRIIISLPNNFEFQKGINSSSLERFLRQSSSLILFYLIDSSIKVISCSFSRKRTTSFSPKISSPPKIEEWLKTFETLPYQHFGKSCLDHPFLFDTVPSCTRIDDFYKCFD